MVFQSIQNDMIDPPTNFGLLKIQSTLFFVQICPDEIFEFRFDIQHFDLPIVKCFRA